MAYLLNQDVSGGNSKLDAYGRSSGPAVQFHQSVKHADAHGDGDLEEGWYRRRSTYARPKTCVSRCCKSIKRWYKRLGLKHLIPLIVIVSYSFLGAILFLAVERSHDIEERAALGRHIKQSRQTLTRHVEMLYANRTLPPGRRRRETAKLVERYEKEIGYVYVADTSWTFWNAMYYSGTIYTTIGYGAMFPATTAGRIFTILYAIIGIPLVLCTLNDLGKFLFKIIYRSTRLVDDHFIKLFRRKPAVKKAVVMEVAMAAAAIEASKLENDIADGQNNTKEKTVDNDEDALIDPGEEEEELKETVRKIPVFVAVGVAVGWIFICAGIFCIWEHNWSYFTSVYFMFISLSTIGLGDVAPDYPQYMIAVFLLVIIGLSLVSMCISVIQIRLEELYMQLLMMIYKDYKKKLEATGDEVGATMGMMQSFQGNKTAKLLLPLLGSNTKQAVARKFQEEAKAQGIDLPPILKDVGSGGVPSILRFEPQNEESVSAMRKEVERKIQRVEEKVQEAEAPVVPPREPIQTLDQGVGAIMEMIDAETMAAEPGSEPKITYDSPAQTEVLELVPHQMQTDVVGSLDAGFQTEQSTFQQQDAANQTHLVRTWDNDAQTLFSEQREEFSQTDHVTHAHVDVQTECDVKKADQELQTHLTECVPRDVQTDAPPARTEFGAQTAKQDDGCDAGVQSESIPASDFCEQTGTSSADTETREVQTDVSFVTKRDTDKGPKPGFGKRLKSALSKDRPTSSALPELKLPESSEALTSKPKLRKVSAAEREKSQESKEGGEDEAAKTDDDRSSESSLEWDPIDGMHAEKQRDVVDIKKQFEKGQYMPTEVAQKRKSKPKPVPEQVPESSGVFKIPKLRKVEQKKLDTKELLDLAAGGRTVPDIKKPELKKVEGGDGVSGTYTR